MDQSLRFAPPASFLATPIWLWVKNGFPKMACPGKWNGLQPNWSPGGLILTPTQLNHFLKGPKGNERVHGSETKNGNELDFPPIETGIALPFWLTLSFKLAIQLKRVHQGTPLNPKRNPNPKDLQHLEVSVKLMFIFDDAKQLGRHDSLLSESPA